MKRFLCGFFSGLLLHAGSAPAQIRPGDATLDINRVLLILNNRGSLDYYDPVSGYAGEGGGFWQYGSMEAYQVIVYDQGLWVIGKVDTSVGISVVQWGSSYGPGPITNGLPGVYVHPEAGVRYHPYKISRGDSPLANQDYAEWPADLGAPVDAGGKPLLSADQTVWMVYNDLDTAQTHFDWIRSGPLPRLPLEVHQTIFAHADTEWSSLLGNTAFEEWTMINKGSHTIDSAYVGFWTDIDFNSPGDNVPASDSGRQLGYCWERYTSPQPKAVGFDLLYGPSVPAPDDTALFRGRPRIGYRNLPLTSFWCVGDDGVGDIWPLDGNAYSVSDAWNIARGLDKHGEPIIDSVTGLPTRFPYNGDPVNGTGWIHPWYHLGGGAGFYLFSGPFSLAPQDTQWVAVALIPATGESNFASILNLRRNADALRSMPYDSLRRSLLPPVSPGNQPQTVILYQNYPNPFNTSTMIRYALEAPAFVRLKVYDLLGREVATLVNSPEIAGRHTVSFSATTLASGIYFYRLQTDAGTLTEKMIALR